MDFPVNIGLYLKSNTGQNENTPYTSYISRKQAIVGFIKFFCGFYFHGSVGGPRSQTC